MPLVLMSVEKCFAVYFPLKAKTICTVKTAKWASGVVGIVLAGFNSLQFVDSESRFVQSDHRYDCFFTFDEQISQILNTIDSTLSSFGPFVLMFLTNFAIVIKFMKAKCGKSNSTESTTQTLSKFATRGTDMVVTVSVMFLVLTSLTAVNQALWLSINLSYNPIYNVLMNVTQYLNHSINGVLYCIVGSRFRMELLKICCLRQRSEGHFVSRSVNSTSLTTMNEGKI